MRIQKGQHVIGEPPPTMPDPPPPLPRGKSIDIGCQASIVRPGDTLIIAINRQLTQLTQAETAELRYHVEHQLPGVQALIIAGASALAVYRPETTP